MDMFYAPGLRPYSRAIRGYGIHELAREPIQQLGVRRYVDPGAEILGRCDQALPEISLPDTIHDYPGRCRIRRVHNPFSQAEPGERSARWKGIEKCRHTRLNSLGGPEPIAALKNVSDPGVRPLLQHHGRGWERPRGPKFVNFLVQRCAIGIGVADDAEKFVLLLAGALRNRDPEDVLLFRGKRVRA